MPDHASPLRPDPNGSDEFNRLSGPRAPDNQDILLRLDVADLDPLSFKCSERLAEALLIVDSEARARIPIATSDALFNLDLAKTTGRWWRTAGSSVPSTLLKCGEILTPEVSVLDPFSRTMLVACWQELHCAGAPAVSSAETLVEWFSEMRRAGIVERVGRKLYYALIHLHESPTKQDVTDFFRDLTKRLECDVQVIDALTDRDPEVREKAMSWLRSSGGGCYNDQPVGPEYHDRRSRLFNNARGTFLRTLSHSGAFARYSGETMGIPLSSGRGQPLFATFGTECFDQCSGLHSSDPNSPPGRGLMFSGARPSRLFFTGTHEGAFTTQQAEKYRAAYKEFGKAFDELEEASFVFVRGAVIVHHPGDQNSLPHGKDGRLENYCLHIPNDHLDGSFEHGFLVPTTRISKSIMGARYDLKKGPIETTGDLASSQIDGMSFLGTSFKEDKSPPYIISLANISTVFGSLAMGLPKNSEPLFAWERDQEPSVLWKDAFLRYHYGWLQAQHSNRFATGGESEEQRMVRRDSILAPYEQKAHEIYEAARGLLNLLDLFVNRYAAWKNDLLPHSKKVPRMASELYRIREGLDHGLDCAEAPQLCIVKTHDLTYSPIAIADPVKMVARTPDGIIHLPRSVTEWDTKELDMWRRVVKAVTTEMIEGKRFEGAYELAFIKPSYIAQENRL